MPHQENQYVRNKKKLRDKCTSRNSVAVAVYGGMDGKESDSSSESGFSLSSEPKLSFSEKAIADVGG
jgi:hypothetical protein